MRKVAACQSEKKLVVDLCLAQPPLHIRLSVMVEFGSSQWMSPREIGPVKVPVVVLRSHARRCSHLLHEVWLLPAGPLRIRFRHTTSGDMAVQLPEKKGEKEMVNLLPCSFQSLHPHRRDL